MAPRTRILHPICEDHVSWIATSSDSLKIRHLRHEPRVSLTYWNADSAIRWQVLRDLLDARRFSGLAALPPIRE